MITSFFIILLGLGVAAFSSVQIINLNTPQDEAIEIPDVCEITDPIGENAFKMLPSATTRRQQINQVKDLLFTELQSKYPQLRRQQCNDWLEMVADPDQQFPRQVNPADFPVEMADIITAWNNYPQQYREYGQVDIINWINNNPNTNLPLLKALLFYNLVARSSLSDIYFHNAFRYALKAADAYPDNEFILHLAYMNVDDIELNYKYFFKNNQKIPAWFNKLMEARYNYFLGGEARGKGWASSVSEENFKIFHRKLKECEIVANQALELNPQSKDTYKLLLACSLLNNTEHPSEYYFQKLLLLQCDFYAVGSVYPFFHRPRWGGSIDGIIRFANLLAKYHQPDSEMICRALDALDIAMQDIDYLSAITLLQTRPELRQNLIAGINQMRRDNFTNANKMLTLDEAECAIEFFSGNYAKAGEIAKKIDIQDYNARRYSNATSATYPFSFIDVPMFARAFSGDNQKQFKRAIKLGQSQQLPKMHQILRSIVYNPQARQDDRLTAMELFARTQNTSRGQSYAFFPCNRGNLLTSSINNVHARSIYTKGDCTLAKEFIDMATAVGTLNDRSSYSRQTFLHHIVQKGFNIEILEYCLKRGADTEISDYHNKRPLYKACTLKNLPAVKLLLQYGADPNALNDVGYSALAMTACYGKEESLPIVDALLAAGADINQKPANGSSPALICAADNHNMLMVKYLISKGANKEIVDGHNINIMDYGIIHKYQPLIDFCESINLAPTRPAAE